MRIACHENLWEEPFRDLHHKLVHLNGISVRPRVIPVVSENWIALND